MARARGLLMLFAAAARATSVHAWDYGAPAASSMPSFARATSSGAPAAVSSALVAHAATASAYAAASGAPAAVSRGFLGSALAPVGVGGSGGGRRPFRRPGWALAAFAGAAVLLTCAPPILDFEDEDSEASHSDVEDPRLKHEPDGEDPLGENCISKGPDYLGGLTSTRRPPSAREVQRLMKMLKRLDRQISKLMKIKKDQLMEMQKNETYRFWELLEDLIKKGKILLSAVSLLKEAGALISSTVERSVLLIEKYGDPIQYYVCPYSGYTEVVYMFLFSTTPKGETKVGDVSSDGSPALPCKFCLENDKRLIHFSTCELYGKTISSFLPKGHPTRKEPGFFVLTEDESHRIFGPIVFNPNKVTVSELVEMLTELSREQPMEEPVVGLSAQQFYGEGYDGSDKWIPDMTLINKQLGWSLRPPSRICWIRR